MTIIIIPDTGGIKTIEKCDFHQVLLSGDQLTGSCARVAQMIRTNSEDGVGHLERLIPVA